MIIKQTDHWVVVNKPAGVNIHGDQQNTGWITELKKHWSLDFLAPVHRLDKVTSGCLLLAKSSAAASLLAQQFSSGEVAKYYLGLTEVKGKKKQGTIVGDMVASRNGSYKLSSSRADPAITQFFSRGMIPGVRINLIRILTGKTHQIRVAMKSNGSPLLGDDRYQVKRLNAYERCYLHHWWLAFNWQGENVSLSCLPEQGDLFLKSEFLQHDFLQQSPALATWPKVFRQ